MTDIIPIDQHPNNLDRTAKLIWFRGPGEVYAVRGGFVRTVGGGLCVAGLFPTLEAAIGQRIEEVPR